MASNTSSSEISTGHDWNVDSMAMSPSSYAIHLSGKNDTPFSFQALVGLMLYNVLHIRGIVIDLSQFLTGLLDLIPYKYTVYMAQEDRVNVT